MQLTTVEPASSGTILKTQSRLSAWSARFLLAVRPPLSRLVRCSLHIGTIRCVPYGDGIAVWSTRICVLAEGFVHGSYVLWHALKRKIAPSLTAGFLLPPLLFVFLLSLRSSRLPCCILERTAACRGPRLTEAQDPSALLLAPRAV